MVSIKVIRSHRDIVAICDSNLLGKKFEEGKLQLDVKESFFKGDEFDNQAALVLICKMLREDSTFYVAGKEAVDICIEAGVISEENVSEVQGIPFALVLL